MPFIQDLSTSSPSPPKNSSKTPIWTISLATKHFFRSRHKAQTYEAITTFKCQFIEENSWRQIEAPILTISLGISLYRRKDPSNELCMQNGKKLQARSQNKGSTWSSSWALTVNHNTSQTKISNPQTHPVQPCQTMIISIHVLHKYYMVQKKHKWKRESKPADQLSNSNKNFTAVGVANFK